MNVLRIIVLLTWISLCFDIAYANAPAPALVTAPDNPPLPKISEPNNEQIIKQLALLDLLPAERALICEKFLKAMRDGDKAAAKIFIAPSVYQKLDSEFEEMHQFFKDTPPLTLQYAEKAASDRVGSKDNVWTMAYSIPAGDSWKNAQLTLFYLKGEPIEIDSWAWALENAPLQTDRMKQDAKAVLVFRFIGVNVLLAMFGGILFMLALAFRSRQRAT